MLYEFGDERQKETYLTALNTGEDIGAFALSEAEAGSDVPAMSTAAERRRRLPRKRRQAVDLERLRRRHGHAVREDRPRRGPKGISSFVVRPEEDDGFIVEGTEDKLGDAPDRRAPV